MAEQVAPARLMTAKEVGERLGTSHRQVKTIPTGELPYFRIGTRGDRRYDPADVERYIAARRVG
jgi:hypothetical protein